VALALILGACGAGNKVGPASGSNDSPPAASAPADGVDRTKTIEFEGRQFTCGQALERADEVCEKDVQNAFNQWGDNLVTFANDPLLSAEWGPDVISFAQLGVAGLAACSFRENDNAFGFTQYMKKDAYGDLGSNEGAVATLYNAAGSSLCPGV
jgi:hypothetical protein